MKKQASEAGSPDTLADRIAQVRTALAQGDELIQQAESALGRLCYKQWRRRQELERQMECAGELPARTLETVRLEGASDASIIGPESPDRPKPKRTGRKPQPPGAFETAVGKLPAVFWV